MFYNKTDVVSIIDVLHQQSNIIDDLDKVHRPVNKPQKSSIHFHFFFLWQITRVPVSELKAKHFFTRMSQSIFVSGTDLYHREVYWCEELFGFVLKDRHDMTFSLTLSLSGLSVLTAFRKNCRTLKEVLWLKVSLLLELKVSPLFIGSSSSTPGFCENLYLLIWAPHFQIH